MTHKLIPINFSGRGKEAELKIKALNTLIDVAEEQLKIDIRKKSGARQS